MTEQTNLGLIWASAGGTTPVGDVKYEGGWVAEIPTYQNFNYMVQGLDKNILHFAESNSYDWQDDINYAVGAKATEAGVDYFCITAHINFAPSADVTNSYWVTSSAVGSFDNLLETSGHTIDLPAKSSNTWTGQEQTIYGNTPLTVYNTNAATTNWAIGNMGGELVTVDLGTAATPDLRDLTKGAGNTHRIFHEGHYPDISEVDNGVEEAVSDGKIYGRRDNVWTEVTTTVVQDVPAPPVNGAGQGWYNTDDGQLYIDIDDGTSSQWVPASPPMIPEVDAEDVDYVHPEVPTVDNVKEMLDLLAESYSGKNLVINGDFQVWQRGTSFTTPDLDSVYTADRWLCDMDTSSGDSGTISRQAFTLGQTDVPAFPNYYLRYDCTTGLAANATMVRQRVEDVTEWGGQTFTLSYYAKADSAITTRVQAISKYGDGSASPNNTALDADITLSTSWQKFEHTFTTESSAGKDVQINSYLELSWIELSTAGNGAFSFDLANVKCELGTVATRFEKEPYGDVLLKCRRYYWRGYAQDSDAFKYGISGISNQVVLSVVSLPTTLRAAPTVAFLSGTPTNCTPNDFSFGFDGFTHRGSVNASGYYRVQAALYEADAEL